MVSKENNKVLQVVRLYMSYGAIFEIKTINFIETVIL